MYRHPSLALAGKRINLPRNLRSLTHHSRFSSTSTPRVIMSQKSPTINLTKHPDGITIIAINRSHARNAVDPPTARRLFDAFHDFENDETQKVCVFHGVNGTFCAGADLKAVSTMEPNEAGWDKDAAFDLQGMAPMGPSRMLVSKPVIAAVEGYAVAGGLELSLIADMRVVEEGTVFGVYCRRFGVPLIDGGTVKLQKVVGFGRAMDMILTGRAVDAKEAMHMGLANRLVPQGKAVEESVKIAKQLLGFPEACMLADRRSVYYSAYDAKSFEDAMAFEFGNGVKVLQKEGVPGAARFRDGAGRHGSFERL